MRRCPLCGHLREQESSIARHCDRCDKLKAEAMLGTAD